MRATEMPVSLYTKTNLSQMDDCGLSTMVAGDVFHGEISKMSVPGGEGIHWRLYVGCGGEVKGQKKGQKKISAPVSSWRRKRDR